MCAAAPFRWRPACRCPPAPAYALCALIFYVFRLSVERVARKIRLPLRVAKYSHTLVVTVRTLSRCQSCQTHCDIDNDNDNDNELCALELRQLQRFKYRKFQVYSGSTFCKVRTVPTVEFLANSLNKVLSKFTDKLLSNHLACCRECTGKSRHCSLSTG